jgi:hypothetical protein
MSVLGLGLLLVATACSSESAAEDPAAAQSASATSESSAASDAAGDAGAGAAATAGGPAALDFGSGTGSITLGDETFELAIGPGTGLCRDVFGIIQAGGEVADGRDIEGGLSIPPLDWETYTDGRYDPPAVGLEITSTGDDNASWRADAAWAEENGKVGMSQVDSYEKEGQRATGAATFANVWDSEDESIQGTFEISCAEG